MTIVSYANIVSRKEEAKDTRWRADIDKYMGGREIAVGGGDIYLMEAVSSQENERERERETLYKPEQDEIILSATPA